MSSLAWDGFGQHNLTNILVCVLTGMGGVWSKQGEIYFVSFLAWRGLVNTLDIHFVSLLAWEGFGQPKLRYILFPHWHGIGFLNTC